MNIRAKLVSIFLILSTILLVIISLIYFVTAKNTLTTEVLNRLDSVSSIQRNRIESLIAHNIERLRLVASRTQLRISLKKFSTTPDINYLNKINRILTDAQKSVPSFKSITILDLDNFVIASTDQTGSDDQFNNSEIFNSGKTRFSAEQFVLRDPETLHIYLSGPLYLEQELIGVIIIESDANNIIASINDYSGLGSSGETILAKRLNDKEAIYLTPLRFDKTAALKRKIELKNSTSPIVKAINNKNTLITEAYDYRNKQVLAASRYIRNVGWDLIVKMDTEEAYAPVVQLIKFFVVTILLALVFIVTISVLFARSLAKPIIDLTATARDIYAGNYSTRAQAVSNDEIGVLAKVFNEMTESIVHKNSELNVSNKKLQSEVNVRLKTEKDLNSQKRRNELILYTSQDGFWIAGLDGSIKEVNEAYCKLLGYSHNQIIGMNICALQGEWNSSDKHCCLDQVAKNRYRHYETKQQKKNGEWLDLEISATFAELENERFIFGFARNISERKRTENELQRYRNHLEDAINKRTSQIRQQAQIIDQIHDSVIVTDLENIIISWNYGAQRQFGYSQEEAIGQPISLIFPPTEFSAIYNNIITPLISNGEYEVEVRLMRKDEQNFYANLSLSMLYDEYGNAKGIAGYSLDITERKRSEFLAKRSSEELRTAYNELESFSYSVSHDLRAPLRSINGFSLALLDDYGNALDETGKNYLNRVRKASQRMGDLIDDMLLLSRVTRKNMTFQDIDLSNLVAEIGQTLNQTQAKPQVIITIQEGVQAFGDTKLLRIVLENLLGNAWKYTSKKANPRVKFGTEIQDNEVVYYIQDNGDGFDMKYVDKLFIAFQRLHKADDFEGTGIGLATVARIINRHGGKTWAKSELSNGTSIFFTLPQNQSEQDHLYLTSSTREISNDGKANDQESLFPGQNKSGFAITK